MDTKTETTFEKFKINLHSLEEVKELQGILDKVEDAPLWITQLYLDLKEVTGVPMGGLYTNTTSRSYKVKSGM